MTAIRSPVSRGRGRILLSALLLVASAAAFGQKIVYPRPVADFDKWSEYPLLLLRLALSKTENRYEPVPGENIMNKARVAVELAEGRLDVAWMVTNAERETALRPIRICVFKGLGGWRVALVKKENENLLAGVDSISSLCAYIAGQQFDWPDTAILQRNGIPVTTTASYDVLFKMLIAGRFDWFPRNIMEIWDEEKAWSSQGIRVEPHLLVKYPSAYYFFVRRDNEALARAIETGLEAALADGSLDALFLECHGDVFAKARVKDRRVIELANPYLPPLTPVGRKDLWYEPLPQ